MTEGKGRRTVPGRWNAAGPGSDMWADAAQDPGFAAGAKLEGGRARLPDCLRAGRLTMEMKCAGPGPARPAGRAAAAGAWQAWRDGVAFAETFAAGSAGLGIRGAMPGGDAIALREVRVHVIGEYARHCGQAGLLRERAGGRAGQ